MLAVHALYGIVEIFHSKLRARMGVERNQWRLSTSSLHSMEIFYFIIRGWFESQDNQTNDILFLIKTCSHTDFLFQDTFYQQTSGNLGFPILPVAAEFASEAFEIIAFDSCQ